MRSIAAMATRTTMVPEWPIALILPNSNTAETKITAGMIAAARHGGLIRISRLSSAIVATRRKAER